MKVILLSDIKGVGKKDQIINANDGYARNYLFPKKLAIPADKGNITNLESKKSSEQHRKELEKQEAIKDAKKMEAITLTIQVKSGDNGRIFGSVTSKEIADSIEQQYKIKIDKKKVMLQDPIKTLGAFNVQVKLYDGVIANLKIVIK